MTETKTKLNEAEQKANRFLNAVADKLQNDFRGALEQVASRRSTDAAGRTLTVVIDEDAESMRKVSDLQLHRLPGYARVDSLAQKANMWFSGEAHALCFLSQPHYANTEGGKRELAGQKARP